MSGGTFDFYNWLERGWGWYYWHLIGEVSFIMFESLSSVRLFFHRHGL